MTAITRYPQETILFYLLRYLWRCPPTINVHTHFYSKTVCPCHILTSHSPAITHLIRLFSPYNIDLNTERKRGSNMKLDIFPLYNPMFAKYPDVVTVAEMQKMLRISKKPAYWLIKTKQVKAIKIGNQYRILKSSIIEFLLNQWKPISVGFSPFCGKLWILWGHLGGHTGKICLGS